MRFKSELYAKEQKQIIKQIIEILVKIQLNGPN